MFTRSSLRRRVVPCVHDHVFGPLARTSFGRLLVSKQQDITLIVQTLIARISLRATSVQTPTCPARRSVIHPRCSPFRRPGTVHYVPTRFRTSVGYSGRRLGFP